MTSQSPLHNPRVLVCWNILDNSKSQVAPVPWDGWDHSSILVLFPADPRPRQAAV